jgi:SNF2 family DNA or RNA helicase
MKFKAHDYQQYAIDFILSHPVCCLILDMGLGKTAITLTAMMELLFNYFLVGKVLVIAPKRVAESTWPAEIKKWEHLTGLTYSVVKGTAKQRNEALLRPADVYIIGRDNVTWLVEKKYFSFDLIVIDELSSFKSPKAQRFKSLRKVRPLASRVIGLTGTPGNPMDLWAEIGILDMGQRLGRFIGAYRERFFVPDKRNGEIIYSYKPRAGAEEQIYELISDISISMKAVDFLNMPECIYNQVKVQMSDTEKNLYERMEADMILQFGEGKDIDAVNAAALNNKLQQMANGAVYNESGEVQLIHDRKLDALEDLIEAANGKPLLVAYWFKHDRDRIMARFKVRDID